MASSIILRRGSAASNLLNKLIQPIRSISVAPSSFNTTDRTFSNGAAHDETRDSVASDERSIDIDRRSSSDRSVARRSDSSPTFFSDVFDPFLPTRSLSQVLNMMDQFMDDPFFAASRASGGGSSRRGWDVKEDDEKLWLKLDMPGLDRDDMKVSVEQNTLIIRGEAKKESEDEEEISRRRYSSRIDLPPNLYKIDEIKAEMKNGVLKVIVPKVKPEERKDVFQVKVE